MATVYVTHDYAEALSLGDRIGVMGDGGLVRVGSSREIFERPNSIFVARHLGQPSINEVPCRLSRDGGALTLRSLEGSLSFAMNGSQRTILEKVRGDVLVGRPQHIHVANGGSTRQIDNARVEAFEALGATGVLIAETGGVSLTVLTSPEENFEPGQPVRRVRRGAVSLFRRGSWPQSQGLRMARVTLTDLNKIYPARDRSVHAVKDLNLTVEDGEYVALLGPSAAARPRHCG